MTTLQDSHASYNKQPNVRQEETLQQDENLKPSAHDNKFKVAATWYTFFVFGLCDGTTGALLPSIQSSYEITYTVVSLLFLCQVLGYGVMSLFTQTLLNLVGRRWGTLIGASLFTVALIMITIGPPFAVVVVAYSLLGFAAGIYEAMLNAYAGGLKEAAMVLGCLHGFYSLGAAISPILATQMVVHGVAWHYYYGVLLGCAVINMLCIGPAFWTDTSDVMKRLEVSARARHNVDNATSLGTDRSSSIELGQVTTKDQPEQKKIPAKSVRYEVLHSRFCLLGATFMFLYLGLEISTSGWISQYLQKVRHAKESTAGFVNSGFWFGLTLGRFALSWPASHLLGEWWACQLFTALGLAFELVFWLAPGIIAPSIGVALQGFWIGPTFPLIMELATRSLDPRLHVTAIGVIASFGSVGGALLPFVIGIGATAKGPKIVPYVLTALFVGCLVSWAFLPGRDPIRFGRKKKRVSIQSL